MLTQYFVFWVSIRIKNNLISFFLKLQKLPFPSHFIYLGYSSLVLHGHSPYESKNIKKNLFDINYMIINISKWALFQKKSYDL